MKRLLDYDPETGVREVFESTDDGFMIHTTQDVEPIIDANKAKQSLGKWGGARPGSEFRQVAEIPIGIQYEWLTKYGVDLYNRDHWSGVKRLLNSSDYRYLKCAEIII